MMIPWHRRTLLGALAGAAFIALAPPGSGQPPPRDLVKDYTADVQPLLQKYCLACHSTKAQKGDLDLERFTSLEAARKDLHAWQQVADQVEIGEMPPAGKRQPSDAERKRLIGWVRGLLDAEARARAGDPGRVVLRRLNNAEYTNTLRDLTGVELNPAREFPADSAAGEGFANTGETLSMSPALVDRYLKAAKDVAAHAVLLPDGFRFSVSASRRDWANEALAAVRQAYTAYPPDGRLPLLPYLQATLKHRAALEAGTLGVDEAAVAEKLNPKYLRALWAALTDAAPSYPLDAIRARWRTAQPNDAAAVGAAVTRWQAVVWKTAHVGSYVDKVSDHPRDSLTRQIHNDPVALATAPDNPVFRRRLDGYAAFRKVFPLFICFPPVVPEDETVTLKMFHREDEPLVRLFLDDASVRRLDRLWEELRFTSRQPAAEYAYLPQLMAYTTQDTPKEFQQFFVDRKPLFKKKAEAFEAEEAATVPAQLRALADFADRAYRRPLRDDERQRLRDLHAALRKKGVSHDEAFRTVLARVLVTPHFLYRIENPPPGTKPGPVSDLELATRLSYFLWASMPDDELRRLAHAGRLHDDRTLRSQAERMLKSPRVRGLATEFGLQWLHIRDIREHKDKSETLFPMFDDKLRDAFFEEAAQLFQDLFQNDRPLLELIDGDRVFVNETLANHYGLTDVKGPEWRNLKGARELGRGGVLTLASVLTKQAGASRTSPVLRGNWVVQTLLGEKLPRPPANVPQLPEGEDTSKLSVRQLVEQHTRDSRCAHCHVRIDPFGFALEGYDPIGRRRQKDLAGRPVDTRATLRDRVTFDGIDGLRHYLLKERRDDFLRNFCRKLLGYALGRSVALSDQPLLEEMLRSLRANDYRVSAAILPIVQSTQFRYIRGTEPLPDDR
jgi:mono/diheme cytochrome c family protein